MALIEDEELRDLFQTESEEHLQSLDEGLLRLETRPGDSSTLEEVFRAAHSLKGTARMLGVGTVESLAHHLEDELGGAKRGRVLLDAASIDRLCFGVDTIRLLVDEAVSGKPSGVVLARALAQLSGQQPLDSAKATPVVEAVVEAPTEVEAPPEIVAPIAAPIVAPTEPYKYLYEEPSPAAPEDLDKYLYAASAQDLSPEAAAPELVESPLQSTLESTLESHVAFEHAAIPMPPAASLPLADPLRPTVEPPTVSPLISQAAIVVADENDAPAIVVAQAPEAPEPLVVVEESVDAIVAVEAGEQSLAVEGEATRGEFKIQTMRVPPARLDALMTLASEMSVTTTRVARGMASFDAVQAMAEEWRKDIAAASRVFNSTSSLGGAAGSSGLDSESMKKLAELHERNRLRLARLESTLERLKQTTNEDMARLSSVAGEMEDGIRKVRLLPFSTIFNLFARPTRDLAREQNKQVQLILEGGETAADKRILEELKDPLLHMIRNAIDHGIELPHDREQAGKPAQATLRLRAFQTASNVIVELSDDGRGLDTNAIKRTALKRRLHTLEELEAMPEEQVQLLIFAAGFSTSPLVTDVSGRGVGMDVVRTNVEKLKGVIQIRSRAGAGCTFHIRLPITLATTRVLLVGIAGRAYALPIEFVHGMMPLEPEQFFTVEGRSTILFQDKALTIARLSDLLELDSPESKGSGNGSGKATCVVLSVGEEKIGLIVDALIDEQEVMLQPLGAMLKRVRNISGATILGAGEVCLILNPHDLLRSLQNSRGRSLALPQTMQQLQDAEPERKTVLLAEDSLTTRTLEKRILEAAGYQVVTAVDGADAFQKLGTRAFDAVVSDVEMPNLSGLGLASKIREDARYNELPIILVTSLASEDDRRRGAEAGANAYITKGTFEQKALLDALERLV